MTLFELCSLSNTFDVSFGFCLLLWICRMRAIEDRKSRDERGENGFHNLEGGWIHDFEGEIIMFWRYRNAEYREMMRR